jgi:hypothetical protein
MDAAHLAQQILAQANVMLKTEVVKLYGQPNKDTISSMEWSSWPESISVKSPMSGMTLPPSPIFNWCFEAKQTNGSDLLSATSNSWIASGSGFQRT